MDMFDASKSAPKGEFDEFGVGKPRPRTEPGLGKTAPGETASLFGQPPATEAKPAPVKVFEEKLVHLLIAEREGTAIFGPQRSEERLVGKECVRTSRARW